MKILIVEDEHKIANLIKQGLEQEKYTIDVAYDGATGFDLASDDNYDLIILDRLLPKMDGLTICKKLRAEDKQVPILMLTAKAQIMDRVEGLENGADDYLAKPFAFEELLARIKALARRPQTTIKKLLKVSDLVLDIDTYEVKRGNKKINLSSKEFALLEYLMRNPNKILAKEQIINHVWSYESNILPNTVEVFIGYLRNKIDKPFKNQESLIHTKRGFGYKIGEEK